MQTARDFFVHELSDMLGAEQRILEALSENSEETTRPELQKAFQQHHQQTETQIDRLEQCFEELGMEPQPEECRGIEGILGEKEKFEEEDPSEDLKEVFMVGAAMKVEHYEITSYESLVKMARELGLKKSAKLLAQNLAEEQATLKKLQTLEKKIKPEQSGMEEMEEETGSTGRRNAGRTGTRGKGGRRAA